MEDFQKGKPEAIAIIASASTSLGLSSDEFKNALKEIADDPQTEFLAKTWLSGPIVT
jgi:hypothetical protein